MKKMKIVIGCLCIILAALVVFAILHTGMPSPTPNENPSTPTEQSGGTTGSSDSTNSADGTAATDATGATGSAQPEPTLPPEATVVLPEELPPVIQIPQISFPFEIPGHELVIEKLAPYTGMYVEDGTNTNVSNVAMLLVHNKGNAPMEYAQISIRYGQEELLFHISALPAGERVVVQEKNGKPVPEGKPGTANALVIPRGEMELTSDQIKVTDNGDNTLTIQNLTNQTIPTVRVFYKYYMADEDVLVGGIAFTVRITRLPPGASRTVQPTHYSSETTRVVMVQSYDSEV